MKLEFFVGGENQNKVAQSGLNEYGMEFSQYLQFDVCGNLSQKNKIKIHIETAQLFFYSINSNESIYDFFLEQQNQRKKLI